MDEKNRKKEKQSLDSQEDAYEFIKETIKQRPPEKKKILKAGGVLVGAGAVFGLAAAVVFSLVQPKLSRILESKNQEKKQVEFPSDEEPAEAQQEQESEAVSGEATEPEEGKTGQQPEEIQKEMTMEDYKNMYSEVVQKAKEASKSMVTVIGIKNDADWFQTPYESQISGLIVADNKQEMFILTEYRIVENVDRIQVQFCDGSIVDARFQKADANTGLTILKVQDSEVDGETKKQIAVATLGNSYSISQGEPVIAAGSPMGYSDSLCYGAITSTTNSVSKIDAEYGILTTDIVGSEEGSGILLNGNGEVVGIITQSFARGDTKNIITGLSVSQVKELIEILSNNEDIVYMGITGQTITPEISEKKGIPRGVFVEGVEVDSPAMQAGIQNADVIVEIDGEKIESVKGYQKKLKSCVGGSTIKVKAMRQGTEGYIEVSFDVTVGAL
ncbi:MAG: S1C family serine protease [Blautia sp.]